MDETIEYQVAQFAAEIEMFDDYQNGDVSTAKVDNWYNLTVIGLDAQQLLESVHRHVSVMRESFSNPKLYLQHLGMLGSVADEIERRRQALEPQEGNDND